MPDKADVVSPVDPAKLNALNTLGAELKCSYCDVLVLQFNAHNKLEFTGAPCAGFRKQCYALLCSAHSMRRMNFISNHEYCPSCQTEVYKWNATPHRGPN